MFKTKAIVALAIVAMMCMGSFNSGPGKKMKEVREKTKQATDLVKSISNLEKDAADATDTMDKLKTLEPFDNDRFQSWMPERLGEMKRESYQFSSNMGNTGTLLFVNEDYSKTVELNIIDGAGEAGSLVYASQTFMTGMVTNHFLESDEKLEKLVTRKGNKAIETYYKKTNDSEIQGIIDNRFIVFAKAKDTDINELWGYIDKLNISKLK